MVPLWITHSDFALGIIRMKLYLFSLLLLGSLFRGCDCNFDPCAIPEVNLLNYLIYQGLYPPPPVFSGSCTLQNDCIEYQNTVSEADHKNICQFQGGTYQNGNTCDRTGKLYECSLLGKGTSLSVKYYYGNSWDASGSSQHCQNVLEGDYSAL